VVCQIWIFQVIIQILLILAISDSLQISEANFSNFSIAVENMHIQVIPQKIFQNKNESGVFSSLNETFITEKGAKNTLYVDSDDSLTVKKKTCCGNFLDNIKNIFKKKK
jgi:hypothetical protein